MESGTAAPGEAQVLRKVALRLLPFIGLLYFVAYLDRVNVGYAALTMNADIGLSAGAYGVALWAMTRAPVAAVAALRETSVIFAALIGAWLLKEGRIARG